MKSFVSTVCVCVCFGELSACGVTEMVCVTTVFLMGCVWRQTGQGEGRAYYSGSVCNDRGDVPVESVRGESMPAHRAAEGVVVDSIADRVVAGLATERVHQGVEISSVVDP